MGEIQTYAGFYTYFVILNDYGIKPVTLLSMTIRSGIEPGKGDVYNP